MSHWAELDENNVVIRVTVGDNDDPNGDEGYQWLIDNLGGRWVKTSYNAAINGFRKHFAGVQMVYDEERDAFISPQPFESWILNEDSCDWEAPIPFPNDGFTYFWDENSLSWQLMDFSE
mgnify:CR=1 FL=1